MLIQKRLIITSVVGLSLPVLALTSGFTFNTNNDVNNAITVVKPAKKNNFEVPKSPFEVIAKKKTNKVKKHYQPKHVEQVQDTTPVVQEQYIPQDTTTDNNSNDVSQTVNSNESDDSASEQIAMAESSNSYTAQNGRYYGKYQLDISYLHGDLSPANQERTFIQYCNNRYGSVENALAFRRLHNWY